MGALVQLLGIKRGADTKGQILIELGIVRKGGNATVVNLALLSHLVSNIFRT